MARKKYVSTKFLCDRYGDITPRTLLNWQKHEKNPFPRPAISMNGGPNKYEFADVLQWERDQKALTIDSMRENQAA